MAVKMAKKPQELPSPARTALATAETDVRHILEQIVELKEARANDLTRLAYPNVRPDTDDYDHASDALEARLAVAREHRAACLADVEAADAKRDKEKAEARADKAESRARILMLVGVLGGLTAAAKIIVDLLKK